MSGRCERKRKYLKLFKTTYPPLYLNTVFSFIRKRVKRLISPSRERGEDWSSAGSPPLPYIISYLRSKQPRNVSSFVRTEYFLLYHSITNIYLNILTYLVPRNIVVSPARSLLFECDEYDTWCRVHCLSLSLSRERREFLFSTIRTFRMVQKEFLSDRLRKNPVENCSYSRYRTVRFFSNSIWKAQCKRSRTSRTFCNFF